MFVDRVLITVSGGVGGTGCVSFHRVRPGSPPRPDGGHGGVGGDVILEVREGVDTLGGWHERCQVVAPTGRDGQGRGKNGHRGEDLLAAVPVGTLVREVPTGEVLADLDERGKRFLAARGGQGGKGNHGNREPWKDKAGQKRPGVAGEERELELDLRLVAEVALVGQPNAGKSSILAALTRVKVKVAEYPFTTTQPVLGVAELPGFRRVTLVEFPGLVAGSRDGAGLGNGFLKHLWRIKLIVQVVDAGAGDDAGRDFREVAAELGAYDPELAGRPRIVIAAKTDLARAEENRGRLDEALAAAAGGGKGLPRVFPISVATGEGLDAFREALAEVDREGKARVDGQGR